MEMLLEYIGELRENPDVVENLPEPIAFWQEECDCDPYGTGRVAHNNGGNYHAWAALYEIAPGVYMEIRGNSRESFPSDTFSFYRIRGTDYVVCLRQDEDVNFYDYAPEY